jgi:hypothetical protein
VTLLPVTSTSILAQADEALVGGGYLPIDLRERLPHAQIVTRSYEDSYGIVSLAAFDTVAVLLERWPDAQADLVELVSRFISRDDAKAWDAYLCLLTPGVPLDTQVEEIRAVRYDTTRVRKIAITGAEIRSISDVERGLLPLLPLEPAEAHEASGNPLDELPGVLKQYNVDVALTTALVNAYVRQAPLMEAIAAMDQPE